MQTQFLLQIGLLAFSASATAQPPLKVKEAELKNINFKLQTPAGPFDGSVPTNTTTLEVRLSHALRRQVFALAGDFAIVKESERFLPVFVCDPEAPIWYQLAQYNVACPTQQGEHVRIFATTNGLYVWGEESIFWLAMNYTCSPGNFHPHPGYFVLHYNFHPKPVRREFEPTELRSCHTSPRVFDTQFAE